jgi:hypothetical protein
LLLVPPPLLLLLPTHSPSFTPSYCSLHGCFSRALILMPLVMIWLLPVLLPVLLHAPAVLLHAPAVLLHAPA